MYRNIFLQSSRISSKLQRRSSLSLSTICSSSFSSFPSSLIQSKSFSKKINPEDEIDFNLISQEELLKLYDELEKDEAIQYGKKKKANSIFNQLEKKDQKLNKKKLISQTISEFKQQKDEELKEVEEEDKDSEIKEIDIDLLKKNNNKLNKKIINEEDNIDSDSDSESDSEDEDNKLSTKSSTKSFTPPPNSIRITKLLQQNKFCSRREAEYLIKQNRITYKGEVISSPSYLLPNSTSSVSSLIAIDNIPLKSSYNYDPFPRIWLTMKRNNEVMYEDKNKNRSNLIFRLKSTIMKNVFSLYPNLKPIYHLDYMTEGLVMFTTSTHLARALNSSSSALSSLSSTSTLPTSTSFKHKFKIKIHGLLTEGKLLALKKGLRVNSYKNYPMDIVYERKNGTNSWLIVTTEEKNNKKIIEAFKNLKLDVIRMICVGFGEYDSLKLFSNGTTDAAGVSSIVSSSGNSAASNPGYLEVRLSPEVHRAYHKIMNEKKK